MLTYCDCCADYICPITKPKPTVERNLNHPDAISYRDMRSASRDKQRHRKHSKMYTPLNETTSTNTSRKSQSQNTSRKYRTPSSTFTQRRSARKDLHSLCSNRWRDDVDMNHALHYLDESHYYFLAWEDDWLDHQLWMWKAGTERQAVLDGAMELGETFEVWCRRRIDEMRAVKEARLLDKRTIRDRTRIRSLWREKVKCTDSDDDEDEGYYSSTSSTSSSAATKTSLTTTLPTNLYDAYGHALIKNYFDPLQGWLEHHTPDYYGWFNEYAWYWHRNETGCWYVLDFPCGGENELCFCEQWKGEEWEGWDPEGERRAWLAECVVGGGWEGLWGEEREGVELKEGRGDGESVEVEESKEWDVVDSSASSSWIELDTPSDTGTLKVF